MKEDELDFLDFKSARFESDKIIKEYKLSDKEVEAFEWTM